MHRFFTAPSDIHGDTIRLSDEDFAHIRVLRLRPGELFAVCDGAGTDYICRLDDGGRGAEIVERRVSCGESVTQCRVFLARSKSLEFAVQKSVELGAHSFVVFPSERSGPGAIKIARLQKIALEAAKQSGRGIVPCVTAVDSFECAVAQAVDCDIPLFFHELEKTSLKQVLTSRESGTVSIMTGPEGGFTPGEAELAIAAGMTAVMLGPRVLRCETAPAAALAAVMYHTEF